MDEMINYTAIFSSHAGKAVPASLHAIVCSVSAAVHTSVVPSVHVLVCACVPGPQVEMAPVATQSPSLVHSPSCFSTRHSGNSVPASLHEMVLSVSSAEHLLVTPSTHLRVCAWVPGPH